MRFKVDLASSTSVYLQVCEQVKYAVATGALQPGDRLPPIREVAAQTWVNRNTVARSYSELERDGVIVSRPGQGSFVAEAATSIQKRERMKVLEGMIRKVFVEAYHFRITSEDLRKLWAKVESSFERPEENEGGVS